MSHGVKYFTWRAGRPRWVPSQGMRAKGAKAQSLYDTVGNYLPLWEARVAAHSLNRLHGVKEPPPERDQTFELNGAMLPPVSFIYFVLQGEYVKIGFSGKAMGRAIDVADAGAQPPTMIVVLRGTRKDEAHLHRMFAADRVQGEWFHATTRLMNFVAEWVKARQLDCP